MVEFSDDAIIGKTLDGTITSWNGGAERVYGYKASEIVGTSVLRLAPEGRNDELLGIMAKLARGERVDHFQTVRVTREGKLIDVSLTVSPVLDCTGAVVGASAISRDITKEKRAADALRESEARYRVLFDTNPLPMWVFDPQTLKFLEVNEAAIQSYGYSREEFLAMTIGEIRPPEDVPALMEELSKRSRRHPGPGTWRHRKKDGTVIDVEIIIRDILVAGAEGVLVLAQDITERRHKDVKLQQSEERVSKAFRASPVAITISTLDEGRYVDANEAFLNMVGYTWEELVGRTAGELGIWASPARRATLLGNLKQSGDVKAFETEFKTKTGETRIVQVSAHSIMLDVNGCLLATTVDVTETKRLEEQFRQAQKMEAVGRLAGGMAHDFNNVLGVIIGHADLLQDTAAPESAALRHVDRIRKAGQRAATLTRQLLAFSRQQVLRRGVLDLNAVVNNVSEMLLRMIGEDIALKFIPGAPLGRVRAALGQVEQILMNLAINARDAMPEGGTILIETADADLADLAGSEHPGVPAGPYVMLSMSDSGCGMDERTLSRIFDPFFTTKPVGSGTGLGLSMVYGVVKQSQGHIQVSSEPGKGSIFKIYFPRISEPADSLIKAREDEPIAGGSETILLVEDDDSMRELIATLLEGEGYEVMKAKDAQEAISAAAQCAAPIDLLLTDVIMPGMSGPEAGVKLQQSRPGLKLIYMSGYSGSLIEHHGVLEHDKTLLQKPFSKRDLLRQVRAALDL